MRSVVSFRAAVLLVGAALALPASAKICVVDDVPAATLLVPYIAMPLDECDAGEPRSRVVIHNHDGVGHRVKVTVWSNVGVPVFDENLVLFGNGSAEFAFGNLLCTGEVPRFGVSLSAGELSHLQAYLTGQQSPQTGDCASLPRRANVAEAYITVDVIEQDTALTPADAGYYDSSVIGRDNALSGTYHLYDAANNFAEGFDAVALEAIPQSDTTFLDGSITFYGRYNGQSASDGREPLPTQYAASFSLTGFNIPKLHVWRETNAEASPFVCGTAPSWFPLEYDNTGQAPGYSGFLIVDPDGLSDFMKPRDALPLATQRVGFATTLTLPGTPPALPTRKSEGWLRLNLQHPDTAYGAGHFGQAWVVSTEFFAGRFQTGAVAQALDTSCVGSDITVGTSGRAQ